MLVDWDGSLLLLLGIYYYWWIGVRVGVVIATYRVFIQLCRDYKTLMSLRKAAKLSRTNQFDPCY